MFHLGKKTEFPPGRRLGLRGQGGTAARTSLSRQGLIRSSQLVVLGVCHPGSAGLLGCVCGARLGQLQVAGSVLGDLPVEG